MRRMFLPLENTTSGWPLETSTVTFDFGLTSVPPGGSVWNGVPTGLSLKAGLVTGTRPRSASDLA